MAEPISTREVVAASGAVKEAAAKYPDNALVQAFIEQAQSPTKAAVDENAPKPRNVAEAVELMTTQIGEVIATVKSKATPEEFAAVRDVLMATAQAAVEATGSGPLGLSGDKVGAGERISDADALRLLESRDLNAVGAIADLARRRKVGNRASYIVNRYINYSNYCILSCQFCSFARKKRDKDGFELTIEQMVQKAREALALGMSRSLTWRESRTLGFARPSSAAGLVSVIRPANSMALKGRLMELCSRLEVTT